MGNSNILFVVPAIYTKPLPATIAELEKAWINGKDFRVIPDGPYVSVRDTDQFIKYGIKRVLGYVSVKDQEPLCLWEVS